ncbi:MAG: hypothetical protein JWL77_559 [Chthonomonadaceae bacterium]|nr:hypothetical protein [Chthonomonadaceae bacterium]
MAIKTERREANTNNFSTAPTAPRTVAQDQVTKTQLKPTREVVEHLSKSHLANPQTDLVTRR